MAAKKTLAHSLSEVVSSPARPGPNGGPQGGATILVPPGWRCLERLQLVPACAVAAKALKFNAVVFRAPHHKKPLEERVAWWRNLTDVCIHSFRNTFCKS